IEIFQVFPYGSVPLKTYLPDGDIDLTAICFQNVEEAMVNKVRIILETEERNKAAEFEVKDVQYIQAEVKLIKCLIQNIVVDLSFNQLGGLCTLCFLEKVDRLIGKNHLFKRSILLIKAWCYYESRILGAHHGLISTYALETLVLYIFNLFHSSMNGPLAVLYRFLDYFSKFEWETYCVSLNGPVHISSLPEIVVETLDNGGGDLLLNPEFLQSCVVTFSVPSRGPENVSRTFPQKSINIVDPLKGNNNLGRSVSRGNFYRIRSAIQYGARKLGQILSLPGERIAKELNKFFMNTMERHGNGERPDVQDPPAPFFLTNRPNVETCEEEMEIARSPSIDSQGLLWKGVRGIRISKPAIKSGSEVGNEPKMLEPDGNSVSGYRAADDAKVLAKTQVSRGANDVTICTSSCSEYGTATLGKVYRAPHLRSDPERTGLVINHTISNRHACLRGGSSLYNTGNYLASTAESPRPLNSLSDLSGDYESHFESLMIVKGGPDVGYFGPARHIPTPPPFPFLNKQAFDSRLRSMQVHLDGVPPAPQFYPRNPPILGGAALGLKDVRKPRGMGTYFPNIEMLQNHQRYREPFATERGRTSVPVGRDQFHRAPREDGWSAPHVTLPMANMLENASCEPLQSQLKPLPACENPHGPPDFLQFGHSGGRGFHHGNGGFSLPVEKLEFGSYKSKHLGSPLPEASRQTVFNVHTHDTTSILPTTPVQKQNPHLGVNPEGVAIQPYTLKDENDFPPL
ncbi:hypothetical protein GIB67_027841, partial [Kingdonia uniflora]